MKLATARVSRLPQDNKASRLKMEPTPARAIQRAGEGPGLGRHHPGHWIKSDLASALSLDSSVPHFFITFLATCHQMSLISSLKGNWRFKRLGPRICQKHQWSRLEAQPGVHMCPNCGHMAGLCSFGASAAITLEQAFHFRTKESGKEVIPQGGVLWAASLELCCQYLDLKGSGH